MRRLLALFILQDGARSASVCGYSVSPAVFSWEENHCYRLADVRFSIIGIDRWRNGGRQIFGAKMIHLLAAKLFPWAVGVRWRAVAAWGAAGRSSFC